MTSSYRRDHLLTVRNDELTALADDARALIDSTATAFEADVAALLALLSINGKPLTINGKVLVLGQDDAGPIVPFPSEGEKLALRRAMARFVIDSGAASARGWV